MELDELKRLISQSDAADFVRERVIGAPALHFSDQQMEDVRSRISRATGIHVALEEMCVVGSGKLGYGLFEKRRTKEGLAPLPAFRPFGPESDIDIAFVSPKLFDHLWEEITMFAISQTRMPHRINSLGDYLVYGWLRPDQFPAGVRLRRFDQWNDAIRNLQRQPLYKQRKISGAVYRDMEFMTRYQVRSIETCQRTLLTP